MQIDAFDYVLPHRSIAQAAIEPRHDARVLIAKDMTEVPFLRIAELLDRNDLLVVNRTKVRAARLIGSRQPTGGKSELLLTKRVDSVRWQALLKPAKKLPVGTIVHCGVITAEVLSTSVAGVATVALSTDGDLEEALAEAGEVPLPPYFHGRLDSSDRYQTLFAKTVGSSAAPTAALHFTETVVESLHKRGIRIAEVDLEIGLDTFRPMDEGSVDDHVIHRERLRVDSDAVEAVRRTRTLGGRVVAVGTTVVRTLESAGIGGREIAVFEGETELFIKPGYQFSVVDAMFTNFHAPRTTLIVMIAAMLGDRWRYLYEYAIEHDYRFLSFGDSMYIEIPT
jgi:S-adenosylmethionine:tRNA ribosyltransferase-isomerase